MEHQVQQQRLQPSISSPETDANIGLESSNTCSSNENSQSSCEIQQRKKFSREHSVKSEAERQRKKKGGKAKGTLETSVEIRNRMIGMAEAGLSTLSIALAIDRSVREISFLFALYIKLYIIICRFFSLSLKISYHVNMI